MTTTSITRHVNAPRAAVYRALIDARAVAAWMVPNGMSSHVHEFDVREGGRFRISLTCDEPTGTGKTSALTDTYHGRFVKLVPDEQVVEVMEFETTDASMRGEMTITFSLTDADGGTDVLGVHDNLPPGISPTDNETGWRMALDKLAAFVESGRREAGPPRSSGLTAVALCALALASCAGLTAPRASATCAGLDEPEVVVCRFYQAYLEIQPLGLPAPDEERILAPYLTPALLALMDDARRYQEAYAAEHPDEKPPFVDGSLFTSNFEGADRFEVVHSEPAASGGMVVTVRFWYRDVPPWEDAVVVTREGGRYAIDDIALSGAGPFNPAGRLTATLSWRE